VSPSSAGFANRPVCPWRGGVEGEGIWYSRGGARTRKDERRLARRIEHSLSFPDVCAYANCLFFFSPFFRRFFFLFTAGGGDLNSNGRAQGWRLIIGCKYALLLEGVLPRSAPLDFPPFSSSISCFPFFSFSFFSRALSQPGKLIGCKRQGYTGIFILKAGAWGILGHHFG
jgi:hypothetical protein